MENTNSKIIKIETVGNEIDRSYEAVKKLDDETKDFVCDFIKDGYKNLLARLLIYVGEEKAEKTLAELPQELSTDLRKRKSQVKDYKSGFNLSFKERVEWEGEMVLEDFDRRKINDVLEVIQKDFHNINSFKYQKIFYENSFVGEEINSSVMPFENLARFDDETIKKVLSKIDHFDLMRALVGERRKLKNKFIKNMTKSEAKFLKKDLKVCGSVLWRQKIEAQHKIMNVALDGFPDVGFWQVQNFSLEEKIWKKMKAKKF